MPAITIRPPDAATDAWIIPLLLAHQPRADAAFLRQLIGAGHPFTDGTYFAHIERHITPPSLPWPSGMATGINFWVPSNGGRGAVAFLSAALRAVIVRFPAAAAQPVYGRFDTVQAATATQAVYGAQRQGVLLYHLNLGQALATGDLWLLAHP